MVEDTNLRASHTVFDKAASITIHLSLLNCGCLLILLLLDTGTSGTSREIVSEDADSETRLRNPSVINQVFQPLKIGNVSH